MGAPEKTFHRARQTRSRMSLPEVVLWRLLRRGGLAGLRFRRQHPAGPYILDFYCASARLAVEVDGSTHDAAVQVQHDARRQTWLAREGIRVFRVVAADVLHDERLEGVLAAIEQAAAEAPSVPLRGPPPPQAGEAPRLRGGLRGAVRCDAAS